MQSPIAWGPAALTLVLPPASRSDVGNTISCLQVVVIPPRHTGGIWGNVAEMTNTNAGTYGAAGSVSCADLEAAAANP